MGRRSVLALLLVTAAATAAVAASGEPAIEGGAYLKARVDRVKAEVEGALGDAMSEKEAAKASIEAAAESVRAKALVGYPFDLYPDCIRTADEWADAFEAGVVKCVAPWLYFRAPDSPADIADLDAAATYIKGPHVSKAFVAPGPGTVDILQASSDCKKDLACDATGLLTKILDLFGISPGDYPAGLPIPLKIFGSDASIFLGTNKGVSRITATWPNWFDAITRSFDLDPRLLGTDPLRELVVAYTTTNDTQAAYNLATGCNTTTPSCDNLTADPNPKCRAYAVAVASFCAPGGIQNYDTASCVDTLKQAPVDSVTGAVSATTARAFYTACFDCYYLFTANGFALDEKTDTLPSREYLVTGNAKLAQTGGYRIVWLGAGKHPNKG